MIIPSNANADAALFGNRFVTQEVPSRQFPGGGMPAADAMRLVFEDLAIEGDPAHNLATFVTTWMEPEAQNIRAQLRLSSAASGCSPTSSTHPGRRLGHEPRDRPRRSCSVRSR